MMVRRTERLAATAVLLPLLLVSCGGGPDAGAASTAARSAVAPAGEPMTTLGTVTARVDGQERTWFVVTGDVTDAKQSSAVWSPLPTATPQSGRVIAVGGFDTERPPLQSFQRDEAGRAVSYGTYDGSVIMISLEVEAGASSLNVRFPDQSPAAHGLIYMPRVSTDDLSQLYSAEDGTLEVSAIHFDGDRASVEGTFSGTFERVTQDSVVRITDGRFSVRNIPRLEVEQW